MQSTPSPSEHNSSATSQLVEAARYALLRRLAHAIRHEMMAHLQPIAMAGEIVGRRLRAAEPDLDQVRDGVGRMTQYSRTAVHACRDVISWISPEAGAVPLQEVVDESLSLLGSSLGFRGFGVRSEVGEAPWPVARSAWRLVLPAGLLLLADSAGPPAEIVLTAECDGTRALLRLTLEPGDGPEGEQADPSYRPLSAQEVAALARAEGIAFEQRGDTIELRAPIEPAATRST